MRRTLYLLFTLVVVSANCHGQTRKDSLIVFVGEKIEVVNVPNSDNEIRRDTIVTATDTVYCIWAPIVPNAKFEAKYKVLDIVYGSYKHDTISFTVYDRYGTPDFSNYKNALLFVSYEDGKLYHQKYQYFNVYKTADGRWASPGDPYRFDNVEEKRVKMKPIKFLEPLSDDTTDKVRGSIDKVLPGQYWRFELQEVNSVLGAYTEDLFIVKKEGVLKARGIFE